MQNFKVLGDPSVKLYCNFFFISVPLRRGPEKFINSYVRRFISLTEFKRAAYLLSAARSKKSSESRGKVILCRGDLRRVMPADTHHFISMHPYGQWIPRNWSYWTAQSRRNN